MSLIEAIVMAIIQGLTEFLPVSSSGHLALFKILFHVETDTGILYDILLHLGTLVAIFIAFYKDVFRLIREGIMIIVDAIMNVIILVQNLFMHKNLEYRRVINSAYRKFVMLVIVSTIPTGIIGIVDKQLVEMAGEILLIPGICLLITGVLLLISDRIPNGKRTPKNITYTNAFVIGISQGLATLPGLSRSGTTIAACLISGFDRKFAVKYSFIMSIPAVLGAAVFEIKDVLELSSAGQLDISGAMIGSYLLGMMISAIVGYVCIKTMLVIVRKKKFTWFACYCFIIGAVSIAGYFIM